MQQLHWFLLPVGKSHLGVSAYKETQLQRSGIFFPPTINSLSCRTPALPSYVGKCDTEMDMLEDLSSTVISAAISHYVPFI